MLKIKPYEVLVEGFGPITYYAESAGKARASAWRSYSNGWTDCTFKNFLSISKVKRGNASAGFGKPIEIRGEPAFYLYEDGPYIVFAWPNSGDVWRSHPNDVETPEC